MVKRPSFDPKQISADAAVDDGFSLGQGELFDDSTPTLEVGFIATANLKPARQMPEEARLLYAAFRTRHPDPEESNLDKTLGHMRKREY